VLASRFAQVVLMAVALLAVPHRLAAEPGVLPYATGDVFIMLQTDPNGEAGSFSFTHNIVSNPMVTSPFSMSDGSIEIFNSVQAGLYAVTMAPATGWEIVPLGDGYDTGCWDDQENSTIDLTTGVATIDVSGGEFVVCTFVLRRKTVTEPSDTPVLSSPRGIGWWKNWGGCAVRGRANVVGARETAVVRRSIRHSSGMYPVGGIDGMTCEQATHLLSKQDFDGNMKANDAAYNLAAQLVAAKLNQVAGAPVPVCIADAIVEASAMLAGLNFTGAGDYLGPRTSGAARSAALSLGGLLERYNDGDAAVMAGNCG
jgi:hypothetical protein